MPSKKSTTRASCQFPSCKTTVSRASGLSRHYKTHLAADEKAEYQFKCGKKGCKFASFEKDKVVTHWGKNHGGSPMVIPPPKGEGRQLNENVLIAIGMQRPSLSANNQSLQFLPPAIARKQRLVTLKEVLKDDSDKENLPGRLSRKLNKRI
ncbi:hypothetical protein CYLTODRAFT_450261 [Cylindrobasidium torrendii FP15055 ss-10]|uniref:C2H2-type domain-containing protein n=1 Tax=Cylindrobasidium torrendii FP15055 ss-10 TaxID=1314674 RepID=A0A0D7BQP9_9AGAR|nr:hypothetical protein CYLTODRAFT_450261 [Cylindrobasidium torrendii FP15055 ss-10]